MSTLTATMTTNWITNDLAQARKWATNGSSRLRETASRA